ncbi:MAG: DNA polymerase III subunit delta' [Deltaproteobacteria bacterium]|nr:MAG: DNA polymerase III subunit delta' [Deltaproteobacteria bacterium]
MAFRDVVGHQRPLQTLQKEIKAGKVHHAYLFTGMEGIGKRLVALNMAKALNCLTQEGDACDHCHSCQRMDKGFHPDLIPIAAEGEAIKIQQIRELQRVIAFKPYEARWRVIIVDGAERTTREAANAFLKTLEEPPPWTTIILVASTVETLPPTVPSRCQRIRFNLLRQEEVGEVLARHLCEEEIHTLAPLAGGSPGRVLRLDREEISKARREFLLALSPSIGQRLRVAQELAHREGKIFLEILQSWLRDLIVYREIGEEASLLNYDLTEELRKAAPRRETEGLLRDFWALLQIQGGIEAHGNLQLSLETALLGIGGLRSDEISGSEARQGCTGALFSGP